MRDSFSRGCNAGMFGTAVYREKIMEFFEITMDSLTKRYGEVVAVHLMKEIEKAALVPAIARAERCDTLQANAREFAEA
jgi:hypothetical protein